MKISEVFDTPVEDKIEPVIKVGEVGDEHKLAGEIGSYVVTPMIEQYLDDMLEHYTDTFLTKTTEIGIWISGYFGSGKSHFAKIQSLLVGNRKLEGVTACERFKVRLPVAADRKKSIERSLDRMNQCDTDVLAFNLNTLADSKTRPLPSLLLSQYYLSCGYSSNLIYARVIEAELDKQGKLPALHEAVEQRAKKPWADIQRNLSFYSRHLYDAACAVAPEVFSGPQDVERAMKEAERGELHNVAFLVDTILEGINKREAERKKPQRLLLVLDESGQWIEDDSGRLSQLQALVEEAAIKGQGKIWIIVTTHGDMGSIYQEARKLQGDMKKIEGRFRFKPALTIENIELVLEDRLFKKKLAGRQNIEQMYDTRSGVLRGLGELAGVSRTLPACTKERFATYYPFFPYQVHLIPEIVKTLRSKGGRGEQMSGSTRTLLAITQDILRAGRRRYLEQSLGPVVSFDELYNNLSGEVEISPDVRTELSRLKDTVPGATPLTPKVAEVLYLIRELPFIPRSKDNIARLLVESVDEDLPTVLARVEPELDRLRAAGLVARIGEEYEFLTGEKRTFEDEVTTNEKQYKQQDRESNFFREFVHDAGKNHTRDWFGASLISYRDQEFPFVLEIDGRAVPGTKGDVALRFWTPLSIGRQTLDDLESRSLRPDEKYTLFFLCGRVSGFDQDLTRYLATKEVIHNWKTDPHKSEDARKLALDCEADTLPKLYKRVVDGLKEGIRTGHIVYQGSNRQIGVKQNQTSGAALRDEMAAYWPQLYPKFDKVPVRIANEQRAIMDILVGETTTTSDVNSLKLFDKAGKINPHCPLLDSIRIHLATHQKEGRRVTGKDLLDAFVGPPYGWDVNAVRVGVAALVRAATIKVVIGKKEYTNPSDRELIDNLRVSTKFNKVELVLEEMDLDHDVLSETRTFLIKLAKTRSIDETPAALADAAGNLCGGILDKANNVHLWSGGAGLPLPASFTDGEEAWKQIQDLTSPVHRVRGVHANRDTLSAGFDAINAYHDFQQKSGLTYTEMKNLVGQLEAIEYRVESNGCIKSFLGEFRAARDSAAFADKEVWKDLQSKKNQAALELTPVLDRWRGDARQLLQDALARLPNDLSERGLDSGLEAQIARPLVQLRDNLDAATVPSQVAAFPDRARALVRDLGNAIADAVRKHQQQQKKESDKKDGKTDVPPPPAREVKRLRTSDVSTVTKVASVEEWESLRDKLDQRVRDLLKNYDVEIG